MAKVQNILIPDEIVDFMETNGFYPTETEDVNRTGNTFLVFFSEDRKRQVTVSGLGRIECRCWNDEPSAERLVTTLSISHYSPQMPDWRILMHLGGILHVEGIEAFINHQPTTAPCYA